MNNIFLKPLGKKLYHDGKLYGNVRLGNGWRIRFRNFLDGWCDLDRINDQGVTVYNGEFFNELDEDYIE